MPFKSFSAGGESGVVVWGRGAMTEHEAHTSTETVVRRARNQLHSISSIVLKKNVQLAAHVTLRCSPAFSLQPRLKAKTSLYQLNWLRIQLYSVIRFPVSRLLPKRETQNADDWFLRLGNHNPPDPYWA